MKIRIKSSSSLKIKKFAQKHPREFSKAIKTGLLRVGLEVRNMAGTKAPYLSGTLRRSLTQKNHKDAIYEHKKKGKIQSVAVGSNLVYARIQEFGGLTGRGGKGGKGRRGSVKIRGKKFLTRAFEKAKSGLGAKIMDEELEYAIKKSIK